MQRRIAIALVIALAAGASAWWRWSVVRGDDPHAIRGSGIIEITEVDVAFEVSGTIAERYAQEGALLDKGEPIARLDDREYRLQVERATAARAAAEARYQLLLKGPRAQDIDQALAAVEAAEADLQTAQREYERAKSLHEARIVSQNEFDRVANTFTNAQKMRDRDRA